MNIIFDYNVSLTMEYRSALSPLLPQGLAPMILDPMTGLKGTPNRKEGFVFVTCLPTDILNYHGNFFETYRDAPQWFVILLNKSDYGMLQLNDVRIQYGLNHFNTYFAPDLDYLVKAVGQILSEKTKVSGKVLICSKHKNADLEKLGGFLFGEDKSKYDTQVLTEEAETDASILFLCGERQNDFQNLKKPDGMDPYFVVLKPEMHMQQYLNPDNLIRFLASEYNMTAERVTKRLFFLSLQYEVLREELSIEESIKEREILIWDAFGLPLARKDRTAENVKDFLTRNYTDGKHLKELFT